MDAMEQIRGHMQRVAELGIELPELVAAVAWMVYEDQWRLRTEQEAERVTNHAMQAGIHLADRTLREAKQDPDEAILVLLMAARLIADAMFFGSINRTASKKVIRLT